ncbi:MAG: Eco57I restriction-modification methylase domain-containing protein [Selenomonadaceae bacterium]|nr:Eco57I restriction-modification methylase domain-containing protein [Selenomonadaceae bacterium]
MPDTMKEILFKNTLQNSYNQKNYVRFLQELLNNVSLVNPNKFYKEYGSLSYIIDGYYHIGNYKDSEGKRIVLLSVQLKKNSSVENARSAQRAFIKKLLDASNSDGAIAAFYTMEKDKEKNEIPSDKWRLSFIRMEYDFVDGKLSQKLTPAKRYSYLVGKDEPCHTALERLYPLFSNDDVSLNFAELEEAFSVEVVTKQFYNAYRDKYLELKEFLEDNDEFMAEAHERNFTSEQFTKKLMGQIVFLYFIQKKGWLGVQAFPTHLTEKEYKNALFRNAKSRNIIPQVYKLNSENIATINTDALFSLSDDDAKFVSTLVKGKAWGEGPKNFMRALFTSCVKQGRNYFDDYLEPLFYEALNINRGDSGFYARFHCRIPFLNGGLFEQMDNYDWQNTSFHIPNEMFSNVEEKGDDADGILDIFDRYNFTMAEDEPMEKEVAIDPEMLGKVFENLLDIKDRKSKGAFYTPREIVHYMCQESLINYLVSNTKIDENDIRKFILYGEYFRDNDTRKTKKVVKDGKTEYELDKTRDLEIPKTIFSFKDNVNRVKEIDDLLANVKIADPAVGSGAFLLGLLNEIVKIRQTLTSYMAIEMNSYEKLNFYAYGRKTYDLKVATIKNCLFACDIEPSATDITKLRLWLSIVIDDETAKEATSNGLFDEHTDPKPLPNLDCNIISGNSLMDEFEGIKLITASSQLNNESEIENITFYQAGFESMLQELIKLQDELYFTKDHNTKEEIKTKIRKIYDRIILHQLQGNNEAIEHYKELKNKASKPFVLWQLYFPKVFMEKRGFDIVIGNPPYGAKISAIDKKAYQNSYNCTKTIRGKQKGSNDTFALFIEKGLKLLPNRGVLTYIVPMSITSSDSMTALHNIIEKDCSTIKIASFSNRPKQVFDSACIRTSIIELSKRNRPLKSLEMTKLIRRKSEDTIADIIKNMSFVDTVEYKIPGRYPKIGSDMELNILRKMFKPNKKLYEYEDKESKTGFYYRTSGGRYFNVVTNYATGSSKEVLYPIKTIYSDVIGAILSTSLFWFYQQAYTDGLDIKQTDLKPVPMPDLENADSQILSEIKSVYNEYLEDIEKNVVIHQAKGYNVSAFKEYKLVKSKDKIDKIDDLVGKLYGLTDEEIEFIKTYEQNVRINE